MQAIITKYLSATNCKGARIKATCARGSVTIGYPHELSGDACHVAAADALISKFISDDDKAGRYPSGSVNPWNTPQVCGALPNGDRAHVFTS